MLALDVFRNTKKLFVYWTFSVYADWIQWISDFVPTEDLFNTEVGQAMEVLKVAVKIL